MEDSRFDLLTRALAAASSTRRHALVASIAGAVLGALATVDGTAKHKKRKHKKKTCAKAGQATSKKRKTCCKGLTRDDRGVCERPNDCTPTTCAPTACGSVPDGCGGTLACHCLGDTVCVGGECQPCDVCLDGCIFDTVQAAINAASAGETIRICAGAYNEALTIDRSLTLIGAGDGNGTGNTILQGSATAPVVIVNERSTARLQSLRVTDGKGGIYTDMGASLALTACTVTGNSSFQGGGIQHTDGTLTLTDCRITGNDASDDGGGIYIFDGLVELINCDVTGNTANENGGGIYCDGNLTLTASTISGNQANSLGGGIYNLSGTVTLDAASRVTGNHAFGGPDSGGGIFNFVDVGVVTLSSAENVSENDPDNCNDGAVPLCVDEP